MVYCTGNYSDALIPLTGPEEIIHDGDWMKYLSIQRLVLPCSE